MRIGLVLAATPPYSETFFKNKIRILKEHGYDVFLLTDRKKGNFEECEERIGFSVEGLSVSILIKTIFRLLLNLNTAIKLFKLNRRDGFTVSKNVLSVMTSAHMFGLKLNWLHFGFATIAIGRENTASAIGAKMAVSVRGSDMHVYTIEHPNCYALTWKRIDRLHPISHYLLNLARMNGFSESTATYKIITPAIDTQFFSPKINRGVNKVPKICTVARLHWIKGLEYVIEALALMRNRGFDFEYHIIGDGDDYKRLYFAAHQFNLTDKIFFHGKQSQDVINEFLSQADLFVMYSLDEGFCNSVLEAQAMGCLTLVSNHPALIENVVDNETGWVVEARKPKVLAESMEKVLNLPNDEVKRIRENAMRRVKESFNLKIQQEAFAHFYEN